MLSKRKDGRYQSSVILENPITGEKERRYFYAYTLQELEAERRRIMNANISDFLLVETFHSLSSHGIQACVGVRSSRCVGRILTQRRRRSASPRHASAPQRSTRARPRRHTAPARSRSLPLPCRISSRGGRRSQRSSCGRVSLSQRIAIFSAPCATRRSRSR